MDGDDDGFHVVGSVADLLPLLRLLPLVNDALSQSQITQPSMNQHLGDVAAVESVSAVVVAVVVDIAAVVGVAVVSHSRRPDVPMTV